MASLLCGHLGALHAPKASISTRWGRLHAPLAAGGAAAAAAAAPASPRRAQRRTRLVAPTASAASSVAAPHTRADASSPSSSFDWWRQWYPLALVSDLDPARPTPAQLMGLDLVVWWDRRAAAWRAFADRCPHKGAAFSEGIVSRKGDLVCGYHGWSFCGAGRCADIPQLEPGAAAAAARSPRACATAYPARVAEGLLWVMPAPLPPATAKAGDGDGDGAAAGATGKELLDLGAPLGLAPELDDPAAGAAAFARPRLMAVLRGKTPPLGSWYVRQLPNSYLSTRENTFLDPSHDNNAHHNIAGLTREYRLTAAPVGRVELTPTGFTATRVMPFGATSADTCTFPAATRRTFDAARPAYAGLAYCAPTAAGRSVLMTALLAPREPPGGCAGAAGGGGWRAALARLLDPAAPVWLQHALFHDVVDGDCAMQYTTDANAGRRRRRYGAPPPPPPGSSSSNGSSSSSGSGSSSSSGGTFMPALGVDQGPLAFRRWIATHGGGGPPVARAAMPLGRPDAPLTPPREDLLDRYHSHTKHCRACSTALANFRRAEAAARAAAQVLAGGATALLALALAQRLAAAAAGGGGPGAEPTAVAVLAAGALLSAAAAAAAWLARVAERWAARFVFVDYGPRHVSKQP